MKYEEADLILRLYDLRREAVMRQARTWWARDFHPTSAQEVQAAGMGEHGAYFRQVIGYWEMAATLVNHGAIAPDDFNACNGEHIFIFAKIEPFLADIRKDQGPNFAVNLEKLVRAMPNSDERLKTMRTRQAAMAAGRR